MARGSMPSEVGAASGVFSAVTAGAELFPKEKKVKPPSELSSVFAARGSFGEDVSSDWKGCIRSGAWREWERLEHPLVAFQWLHRFALPHVCFADFPVGHRCCASWQPMTTPPAWLGIRTFPETGYRPAVMPGMTSAVRPHPLRWSCDGGQTLHACMRSRVRQSAPVTIFNFNSPVALFYHSRLLQRTELQPLWLDGVGATIHASPPNAHLLQGGLRQNNAGVCRSDRQNKGGSSSRSHGGLLACSGGAPASSLNDAPTGIFN